MPCSHRCSRLIRLWSSPNRVYVTMPRSATTPGQLYCSYDTLLLWHHQSCLRFMKNFTNQVRISNGQAPSRPWWPCQTLLSPGYILMSPRTWTASPRSCSSCPKNTRIHNTGRSTLHWKQFLFAWHCNSAQNQGRQGSSIEVAVFWHRALGKKPAETAVQRSSCKRTGTRRVLLVCSDWSSGPGRAGQSPIVHKVHGQGLREDLPAM